MVVQIKRPPILLSREGVQQCRSCGDVKPLENFWSNTVQVCDECITHRRRYRAYGLLPEEYTDMRMQQACRCNICGIHEDSLDQSLAVDHCHETGAVRSLLCNKCNLALGRLQDDPEVIQAAIDYLEQRPSTPQSLPARQAKLPV